MAASPLLAATSQELSASLEVNTVGAEHAQRREEPLNSLTPKSDVVGKKANSNSSRSIPSSPHFVFPPTLFFIFIFIYLVKIIDIFIL